MVGEREVSSTTRTWSPGSSTRQEASDMSSHREAPEISKDPVADGTDVYAFVSPDRPGHGHPDRQLHPAPEAGRRPELLRVRRRRALRDPRRQPGHGRAGRDLPVPVPHQGPEQEDVPLQHRADHRHRGRDLEPAAVLQRDPGPERQDARCSAATCPARRSTSASAARPTTPRWRSRRCTRIGGGRKVFAGQRADAFHVDLGSVFDLGGAAAVQRGAPDLDAEHGRRQRRPVVQRAHHRDPGADHAADPQRQRADQRAGARAR